MKKMKRVIELNEDEIKVVIALKMKQDIASNAFNKASHMVMIAFNDLWDLIYDIYPETKHYKCSFNFDTMTIQIGAAIKGLKGEGKDGQDNKIDR